MFSAWGPFWPWVMSKVTAWPSWSSRKPGRVDVGVVGEDVGAAAVLRDEAEALFRVEPLDGSAGHASASQGLDSRARTVRTRR